ncbi:MAG: YdcF family protein [Mucilaginibacter sp.]|nr:YdcF family protein [Mucilaginibacter sp.]
MYFIFSKLLLFLLYPLFWITVLLFIALLSKRPKLKKRSFAAGLALLVIFTNPYLLYVYAKHYDIAPVHLDKKKVYSAAILLGGFSGEDQNGNGFFNDKADRFIQGIKLKATGQVSHIMVSGGNGNLKKDTFTEAGWVKGQLQALKFPDSVILTEQQSRNTLENAAFSKKVLEQAHLAPPYLLVTSSWHMRRSLYIFKKAGLDVIPYPCGYLAGNTGPSLSECLIPDGYTLNVWVLYLKELAGLAVTHVKYTF